MTLTVGDKAPQFSLPGNAGSTLSLSDFAGKNVVLYFYPKDDTPGCTTEAKDFTSLAKDFEGANTVVIGMSKDTAAKHDKFIAKHDLTVLLASDEDGTALEEYGVWVEKNMYGRKYMGIQRATFLIDAHGVIKNIWPKVKVKGHAEDVLEQAKAI
ncbi:MAG: thioredoxin-dependent thiol peroxidase [Kordiimonadaceae bacterium]|nr:thioredoxin-dependent thiol peroxidase [Kordiimonadaceae bacterium]MBO6570146.1 thioredoxin-dependent thiol peroxidase [Kordiimonadaceae bacterium]MBO6965756.1 thioredoxin-dependent thiol peroxidase [Kordiimonadaceae bacterium]